MPPLAIEYPPWLLESSQLILTMVHVHKRKKDEDDEQGPLVSERMRELSKVDVNDMWVHCMCFPKATTVPPNGLLLFAQLPFHSSFSIAHSS
jgi:hypothetical protein